MPILYYIIIGALFGFLASLMSFVITYEEYSHRFIGKRLIHEALSTALFTFGVFLMLSIIIGFVINKYL
jgi:H+/Cl- antiporter ClcA